MKVVPYRMWVGYYLLLLAQQDSHPKTVLDVACGTGTMCEMLTREGLTMSGFDLSNGMIETAIRKARRHKLDIQYFVADARTFDLGETYDAALSFFDSLNNILTEDELRASFQRVFAHVKPGGSFIFDLNTAYAFEADLFNQENSRTNAKLRYLWKGDYDPETQIITVRMQFWWRGEEFVEVHRQKAFDPERVMDILEDEGFREIRAYHSYTLNPPRFKSDRLHYTAIRP